MTGNLYEFCSDHSYKPFERVAFALLRPLNILKILKDSARSVVDLRGTTRLIKRINLYEDTGVSDFW